MIHDTQMSQTLVAQGCWKTIGVRGDGSCSELAKYTHCRNCPVFTEAGRALLERPVTEEYRAECASLMTAPKADVERGSLSMFLFRLKSEWLALPTSVFVEVAEMRKWRPIPFRTNPVCLGLVNIRGELQVCVSIEKLLGIPDDVPPNTIDRPRIMVIVHDHARWATPVDEIFGLARLKPEQIRKAPVALSKAATSHLTGVFVHRDHQVGVLDPELVCYELTRSVQ